MTQQHGTDRPLVLHHYPESPFAEKIRLILGFKGLKWKSVTIPIIMPKPDLIALTGGYRKTPVLQIGSDVYCDTALIARVLDGISSNSPMFPEAARANASVMAAWADSVWFSACVAWATQPEGIKSLFPDHTDAQLAAFGADRKTFRAGGSAPRMNLAAATPILLNHLDKLDHQFSDTRNAFLLGARATIADFALYHPLWFIQKAQAVAQLLEGYPNVQSWMRRMAAFGHGQFEDINSSDAIDMARIHALKNEGALLTGKRVQIAATDYGVDPTTGVLLAETQDEWVIARTDPRAGTVHVHFPRIGYSLTQPS